MSKKEITEYDIPDGRLDGKLRFCGLQVSGLEYKSASISDTCDRIASSYMVVSDPSRKLFRCEEHRGRKREHKPHLSSE